MSDFENDIRNVFEDVEFAPSERVWQGVEAALQAKKKKKGIFFLWQTYGVAAGLILALTFGFLYSEGYLQNNDPARSELGALQKGEEDSSKTSDSTNQTAPGKQKQFLASEKEASSEDESTTEVDPSDDVLSNKRPLKDKDLLAGLEQDRAQGADPTETIVTRLNTDLPTQSVTAVTVQEPSPEMELARLKAYRNSLAADILIWNSKLNLVPMTKPSPQAQASLNDPGAYRQISLNGSLGNNILNLASDESNVRFSNLSALRDPNSFTTLAETTENGEDQALGAISAGAGVSFELGRKLSLNLGARYSEFRFRNTANSYSIENGRALPIYLPVGFDNSQVFFVGSYELTNTIQSLFLQSTVGYKLVSIGKFDLSAQVGVGLDYFIGYKVRGELNFLETRKVDLGNSDFLNRANLSGISGIGMNYKITPKFGLSVDLNYRRFFSGSNESGTQPSSVLGFGMSLNYFLNRKKD